MFPINKEYNPIISKAAQLLLPNWVRVARHSMRILEVSYGHRNSIQQNSAIDKEGNPIPWFTYPAIEYIKQIDLSQKRLFEYGCGNSTLFFAKRMMEVKSVENNEFWHKKIKANLPKNAEIKLAKQEDYIQSIHDHEMSFDVIVVDGKHRYDCAVEAVKKINPGGLIILDNSNWFVHTTELLREANFIQVDMAGFAPICWEIQVTSFFFHRDFNFQPRYQGQPQKVTGTIKKPFQGGDTPFLKT